MNCSKNCPVLRARWPAMRPSLWLLASGFLLPACAREEVSHARVPKSAAAPHQPMPPMMQAGKDELPAPPKPGVGQALSWTLPHGWTDSKAASGMRYATLKPPTGQPEVTIVVLPGSAGGELPNVNRWRGQIGLSPLDDAGLAQARKELKTAAGAINLYDLAGEGAEAGRMLAAILTTADGNTWFIKLQGTTTTVAPLVTDFQAILQSLRFE